MSAAGQEGEGQIILFVDAGRLSYLEYVSFDDEPPSQWPSRDRISVIIAGQRN